MSAIHIHKENFEQEVLHSDKPVLVDFWAAWCNPCQRLLPIVDEVAGEVTDVKVGKINIDDSRDLARKYRVMSIPTLVLFENGQEVRRVVGPGSKDEVLELLKK